MVIIKHRPYFLSKKRLAQIVLGGCIFAPIFIYFLVVKGSSVDPMPLGSFIPPISSSYDTINGTLLIPKSRFVMLFVSPECEHCQATMINYHRISKMLDIPVVAVTSARRDDLAAMNKIFSFHFISDDSSRLKQLFRIIAVPTVLFIDDEYRLAYRHTGRRSFSIDSNEASAFFNHYRHNK